MKSDFVELSAAPPAWTLSPEVLNPERLDSSYYRPEYLRAAQAIEDLPLEIKDFRDISTKLNCGATPVQVEYGQQGMPLIRTSNVRPNIYDASETFRVPGMELKPTSNVAILPSDILYTMSGSVGFAAVYPASGELASCSNTIARARLDPTVHHDPYFIALFLNSSLGVLQSDRLISGGVLAHVMPNSVKRLRVALPERDIQRAIGNKLRKAEILREQAKVSLSKASTLVEESLDLNNLSRPSGITAWTNVNFLSGARLDAEYYQPQYTALESHIERLRSKCRQIDCLEDLVEEGSYGVLPPSTVYGQGDLKFLRSEALGRFLVDVSDPILVPRHYANRKAMTRENDLLLEVKGKIEGGAICPRNVAGFLVNGSIYRMTMKPNVHVGYVLAVLLSTLGQLQKERAAANSIINYLSLDFINALVVPRFENALEATVDSHIRTYQRFMAESEDLMRSANGDIEDLISNRLDRRKLLLQAKDIKTSLDGAKRKSDRSS